MNSQIHDGLISPAQRTALCQQFTGGALSLFEYAPEKNAVDGMIAAAHFFAPDFTLFGECVFLTAIMLPGLDKVHGLSAVSLGTAPQSTLSGVGICL